MSAKNRWITSLVVVLSVLRAFGQAEHPVVTALTSVSEDVREYNEHVTVLASPWMEGRLPGTAGMERAKDYVEFWYRRFGLQPAFASSHVAPDGSEVLTPRASYRQAFPLKNESGVRSAAIEARVGADLLSFERGRDFSVLALGGSGDVSGPMVFAGYAIEDGPGGYESLASGDDLAGKIVLVLRYEPISEGGRSRWHRGNGWSNHATLAAKIETLRDRHPAAIVLVNTPGTDDPRSAVLTSFDDSGPSVIDVPVVMMSIEAADRLVRAADPLRRSLEELRQLADEGRAVVELAGTGRVEASIETRPLMAENVGALLPGRGGLANEYIVLGAHLDHLGMGYFSSMSGPGELHPGADDNASGSAGLLLLAEKLQRKYEALPEGAEARSILFLSFSAEESGLNGSKYYTEHPIVPIDDHVFMINMDMIGRLENGKLSVTGYTTADGLKEWLEPYFEKSPLKIVYKDGITGDSDHASFMAKRIPILFVMDADIPEDYHRPSDVSWKINRVGAVETVDLVERIAMGLATRPERFAWSGDAKLVERKGSRSEISVRFGMRPAYGAEGENGVPVEGVSPDSPAEKAGLKAGDRLVRWDGQDVSDIYAWMEMMKHNKPGDEIKVVVVREGREVTLDVVLEGR